MQNRYVGDIGDFGKLGILREISKTGLSMGVNWYLTPDEEHNGDGRHIRYLKDKEYGACDEFLWKTLGHIVDSGQRQVSMLEKNGILQAEYYSEQLDFKDKGKSERVTCREQWHNAALARIGGCDIVFVDPDNGLLVPSADGTKKSNKYAAHQELADYYKRGASVIYYQHKARRPDSFYVEQHDRLLRTSEYNGAYGLDLKFTTTSLRYYFFIIQPKHKQIISDCVGKMLKKPWQKHFCTV